MKWHNAIWTVVLGVLLWVAGVVLPLNFSTVAIADQANDEYISPKQITPPSLKNTIENEVRFNNEIRKNESGETEIVPKIERFPPKAAAEQLKRSAENLQERLSSEESLPENAKRLKRELRREEPPEMDAVGMEAHGTDAMAMFDFVKQAVRLETGRAMVLRQAIVACRKGGTVSVPGVYGGFIDKMPMGAFVNKALTMKSGQTHMHRYLRPLLERIQNGEIDPSFIITHRLKLEAAPHAYEIFKHKQDNCIKVVLKP